MDAAKLESQTYRPGEEAEQVEQVAQIHSFLEAHVAMRGHAPAPRYLLAGGAQGEQVEIPEPVYRAQRGSSAR